MAMRRMFSLGVALALVVVLSACEGKLLDRSGKPVAGVKITASQVQPITRFTLSSEGVIADSKTGLEWVVGPDRDTNYAQAEQWVSACKAAGGGWRMPTRQELRGLYQQGVSEQNMDPVFKTTGWWVWAEPRFWSSAWDFNFARGYDSFFNRDASYDFRVFGVRSRARR